MENPASKRRIDREKKRWDEESQSYDSYHEGKWGFIFDHIAALVSDEITAECRIVELGCGTGLVTLRLATLQCNVLGYDISEGALQVAREKAAARSHHNVSFEKGDAYNIPESDASFDIVLCCYLLDVVEDPSAVLLEAKRLLKPGGTLVTVTDCFQDTHVVSNSRKILRAIKRAVFKVFPRKALTHIPHDTILTNLTRDAGYRVVDTSILDLGLESQGLFNLYIKAKPLF